MFKKLLTGMCLCAAISATAQTSQVKAGSASVVNMTAKINLKIRSGSFPIENSSSKKPIGPVNMRQASQTPQTSWMGLSNSMNIYGMVVSNAKPLQYNDELCAVSFVHRKPETYLTSPVLTPSTAASGVIIAAFTQDWGEHWDSTCIWSNNANWGRYPQGGIYSPPTNTSLANSYIVATGPITTANANIAWWGSYLASKKLDVIDGAGNDSIASTATGAQKFFPNTSPFDPMVGKFDFPRLDFTVTDDGKIRALALLATDVNGGSPFTAYTGFMGAIVLTGTFNPSSLTFDWDADTIIPSVKSSTFTNANLIIEEPHMAWNEAGNVGYVWFLGCRTGATGKNSGFQPIIYKTTDGGQSWSTTGLIDFNDAAFNGPVLSKLDTAIGDLVPIPHFNSGEGVDGIVDMNNRLHIVSTLVSTSTSQKDSLIFVNTYSLSSDNVTGYNFPHRPGRRAYLYDFYELPTSTSGWSVTIIDTIATEGPGISQNSAGYIDNPWDDQGGNPGQNLKVACDSRIQLSRTPDGKYIIYTWAESDSTLSNNKKWNVYPNVIAKMRNITTGAVHPKRINITGSDIFTNGRAFTHFVSPKCASIQTPTAMGVALGLPITVSNNDNVPLIQGGTNKHWYNSAILNFDNEQYVQFPCTLAMLDPAQVGIAERLNQIVSSSLYPNPTKSQVNLSMTLKNSSKVHVEIFSITGERVKDTSYNGTTGDNTFDVDLQDLSKGVYMTKITVKDGGVTKKLIIE
jgi:hypothetical protein